MGQVIVLKIYKGNKLVEEKRIRNTPVVFGSSDVDSHVVLRGDVSPTHARIEKRGSEFLICDLGSERGTFKNLDKILEAQLQHGDTITLGEFSMEFGLEEEVEAPGPLESDLKEKISKTNVDQKQDEGLQTSDSSLLGGQQEEFFKKEVSAENLESGSKETISGEDEGLSSLSSSKNISTFAPPSSYKGVDEFVKPSKGPTVEVLVAWRERIISAHHFSKNCSVVVGIDPNCDVVVPLIASNVSKAPLIQISNQAKISLFPGMEGVLITDRQSIEFNQLSTIGRGSGRNLVLKQNEMVRIRLGGGLELIVRYSPQAPKPVIIPFMDFSSNGFLAVLLALVLSGILMLWVALNRLDKIDRPEEEEFRTALIITNPPPPPPKVLERVKLSKPKKTKPSKKEIKKLVKQKKPKKTVKKELKNKIKMDLKKKKRSRVTSKDRKAKEQQKQKKKSTGASRVRSAKQSTAKNMGSVKKGGSVKNTNKQGAQMQSEKKLKKSGIFSAFGSGGRNNRLDQSYGGSGELAGLANEASGSAGFAEDRPGKGLGSKFKDTGGYKDGSNVGVTRLNRKRKNSLGGFTNSLGDRKTVTIIPGGGDEEFSGQIDRDGIRRVFIDNQRVLRSCYERELNKNPSLSGIIRLNFDIGQKGRVVGQPSVNWGDSSMKSRSMAGCILNRLKSWRFPEPPKNEIVNVIYPLAFSAK